MNNSVQEIRTTRLGAATTALRNIGGWWSIVDINAEGITAIVVKMIEQIFEMAAATPSVIIQIPTGDSDGSALGTNILWDYLNGIRLRAQTYGDKNSNGVNVIISVNTNNFNKRDTG